ncbi:MAG: hypothetical protein EZS28_011103 [Streblomastix strix]|uniref:CCDC81 HU domain-containing protein n=1 Tax=Streblomastix strix TaxID=222440 RepID=A0A5J4WEM1_9EUKA|nr:MAG: hypothetical protein EZS28_011103 [Streblomastix strix]
MTLQEVAELAAMRKGAPTAEQLENIWRGVQAFVQQNMRSEKGCDLPKFGNFTFHIETMNLGTAGNVHKKIPLFKFNPSFQSLNNVQIKNSVAPTPNIPQVPLSFVFVGQVSGCDKDTAQSGYNLLIQAISDELRHGQSLALDCGAAILQFTGGSGPVNIRFKDEYNSKQERAPATLEQNKRGFATRESLPAGKQTLPIGSERNPQLSNKKTTNSTPKKFQTKSKLQTKPDSASKINKPPSRGGAESPADVSIPLTISTAITSNNNKQNNINNINNKQNDKENYPPKIGEVTDIKQSIYGDNWIDHKMETELANQPQFIVKSLANASQLDPYTCAICKRRSKNLPQPNLCSMCMARKKQIEEKQQSKANQLQEDAQYLQYIRGRDREEIETDHSSDNRTKKGRFEADQLNQALIEEKHTRIELAKKGIGDTYLTKGQVDMSNLFDGRQEPEFGKNRGELDKNLKAQIEQDKERRLAVKQRDLVEEQVIIEQDRQQVGQLKEKEIALKRQKDYEKKESLQQQMANKAPIIPGKVSYGQNGDIFTQQEDETPEEALQRKQQQQQMLEEQIRYNREKKQEEKQYNLEEGIRYREAEHEALVLAAEQLINEKQRVGQLYGQALRQQIESKPLPEQVIGYDVGGDVFTKHEPSAEQLKMQKIIKEKRQAIEYDKLIHQDKIKKVIEKQSDLQFQRLAIDADKRAVENEKRVVADRRAFNMGMRMNQEKQAIEREQFKRKEKEESKKPGYQLRIGELEQEDFDCEEPVYKPKVLNLQQKLVMGGGW